MAINQEDKNKLKRYGKTLSLEDSLRNPEVNQDSRLLSNISLSLGDEILSDPLMALRMPLSELSFETQRYMGYNFDNEGSDPNYNGFNINKIVTDNLDDILNEYINKLNPEIKKAGKDKIKASFEAGKELMKLEPEQVRALSKGSDRDKQMLMYGQRASNKPYLSQNVSFYEDPSQARSLMTRLHGEAFLKEIKDAGGNVTHYEIDKDKLKSHYDITDSNVDTAKDNKMKYAMMATQLS
mgnify:CR=1 FL=1